MEVLFWFGSHKAKDLALGTAAGKRRRSYRGLFSSRAVNFVEKTLGDLVRRHVCGVPRRKGTGREVIEVTVHRVSSSFAT